MASKLISETIAVRGEDLEPPRAIGEPGVPKRFTWRGREVVVARVLNQWRQTRPCTHGSGEQYAFKHWFEIESEAGERMKLYFERKPRSSADSLKRWWLFSVESCSSGDSEVIQGTQTLL